MEMASHESSAFNLLESIILLIATYHKFNVFLPTSIRRKMNFFTSGYFGVKPGAKLERRYSIARHSIRNGLLRCAIPRNGRAI
jgi:hypothetical protein